MNPAATGPASGLRAKLVSALSKAGIGTEHLAYSE
jgi:hypothetical protein